MRRFSTKPIPLNHEPAACKIKLVIRVNFTFQKTIERGDFCSVGLTRYHKNNHIKENEISRACSAYGGEEMCLMGFGVET